MADIGADVAGPGKADHGVHVGAIEIDLTAMRMDDVADFADIFLKHAVRRWIGDHAAREVFPILLCFCTEIIHVDIAAYR